MKRIVMAIFFALALTGCGTEHGGTCELDVHPWGRWSEAAYDDKLQAEVQSRECDACGIKQLRKVNGNADRGGLK